jgi:hypothetical protein
MTKYVMPGLDPGIHGYPLRCRIRVDGRVKPGHDGCGQHVGGSSA